MNLGLILLSWLTIAVVTIAALVASGILSIKIEIDHGDDEEDREKHQKEK